MLYNTQEILTLAEVMKDLTNCDANLTSKIEAGENEFYVFQELESLKVIANRAKFHINKMIANQKTNIRNYHVINDL